MIHRCSERREKVADRSKGMKCNVMRHKKARGNIRVECMDGNIRIVDSNVKVGPVRCC